MSRRSGPSCSNMEETLQSEGKGWILSYLGDMQPCGKVVPLDFLLVKAFC